MAEQNKKEASQPAVSGASRQSPQQPKTFLSRLANDLKKPRFWLEILTLIVIGIYTNEAWQANKLTRAALEASNRAVIRGTSAHNFTWHPDTKILTLAYILKNDGRSPATYFMSKALRYSRSRLPSMWSSMSKPEPRVIFPSTTGDGFDVGTAIQGDDLGRALAAYEPAKGYIYLSVWIWYGQYRTFICEEYTPPLGNVARPCKDPYSNYAD